MGAHLAVTTGIAVAVALAFGCAREGLLPEAITLSLTLTLALTLTLTRRPNELASLKEAMSKAGLSYRVRYFTPLGSEPPHPTICPPPLTIPCHLP